MNKVFLIALFSAVAVSAQNQPPAPEPTPGPPVPLAPTPVVCPTDRDQCTDDHVSCSSWASNGKTVWPDNTQSECRANAAYMLKRCSLSCCAICQTCPGENRRDGNSKRGVEKRDWPYIANGAAQNAEQQNTNLNQCVKDKHALCPKWAEEGECHEYRDAADFGDYTKRNTQAKWMHENCNSACCPGCAQSCPTEASECSNDYGDSSCVRWGRAGECGKNPTWMNENCAKECCPACRPTPVEPPMYPQQPWMPPVYQQQPYQQFNGRYTNRNPYATPYGYGR